MGQVNENDNNRNRKYKGMDHRIAETYSKDSVATSKTALADPYVKAIRWASDRIGPEGVVALITNSGFLDAVSADGMRKNLARDFESIFILDLGGNVRKNPKLSGTTHNVFGIQVGVSINLFVRNRARRGTTCRIFYSRTEEFWTKEQKYRYLESTNDKSAIDWQQIPQPPHLPWSPHSLDSSFEYFTPIATPEGKQNQTEDGVLFQLYSRGAETTRDRWLYNFSTEQLTLNTKRLIETYNTEVHRWTQYKGKTKLDEFLMSDETRIKWSSSLKQSLDRGVLTEFEPTHIRRACYRPFTKEMLYFDDVLMHRTGRLTEFFPSGRHSENILIWLKVGAEWPMFSLATDCIPDLLPAAGSQCFPFYVYNEDGSNQRENITDWALKQYRTHYGDSSISKWDIFYHAYAVLQHPTYRERYAANMRQELPRIPLSSDFRALVQTGERLTRLHTEYEKQPEYKLEQIERPGQQLDLRVEKMRLTKDRAAIIYNDFLTLKGIPPETYEYRLGNRSALEWIVDQYQVSTDERSGISNDPNREEDPEYIIRLIGQVITVNLETLKLVRDLASLTL
jgi:predicted helicase